MPPSRSQASSSSTPRSARLVGPYSFPDRLPALPDLSLTRAWYYNLPELDDYVQPDPPPPKPKFMTVEAMAAIVREKARQAEKAKQEYQKKALAAEKARQESEAKRVEYESAKANLQWVRLMSPLDYAEMMTAMQQMRQAEGRWMDSLPRQESHWPRAEEEDDLEMVRYIRMRWVRVEDEGVSLDDGGWTQVGEEVETTKAEMIRYFKANYQQSL